MDDVFQFIEAQQAAEEKGARSFVCPICGGNAKWARAENGHLHAVCEWCGIEVVE